MIVLEYLRQLLAMIDIPALVLAVLAIGGWMMVRSASKKGHYSFAEMLKDESGKESITKIGTLVALIISTWVVMYQVMHTQEGDPTILLIYLSVWASVPVGVGLTEALKSKWSK